jgi:spore maturation protein CgeB
VTLFEPANAWSIDNLRGEEHGHRALQQFAATYPELLVQEYDPVDLMAVTKWREALLDTDIVIVHEWNPPALAELLLKLRRECGFRLIFHDTHHRASSSPEQIRLFGIDRFDAVLVFGEALRSLYRKRFYIDRVWTLHEAADTTVFTPKSNVQKSIDIVWIGNWGDDERSSEINRLLLQPASSLPHYRFSIYGVRYPKDGVAALCGAGVHYGGYLPNLDAPAVYATSRITLHIPRQQYATAIPGIPTIRVFEALACGIPLISAPWRDEEKLFCDGDFLVARNAHEMGHCMEDLLHNPEAAEAQAARGLQQVLARHTCRHRARQLTTILEESLA